MTTKEDYHLLTDIEEGELLISALIEEILQKSHDVLFEKHIESQVLPYAVAFARETIIGIVEWEFFKRDPGEIDPRTWLPDEEPSPATTDSWARGAIPVRKAPPQLPRPSKPASSGTVSKAESRVSLLSEKSEDDGGVPTGGEVRRSISGRPSAVNPPKASAVSLTSSKDRRPSAMSLTSSSRTLRKSLRAGSARRPGHERSTGEQGLTRTQMVEMGIQEENKRTLSRIQSVEKEGGRAEYGYDFEGRVVVVKKPPAGKTGLQGLKTRVIPPASPPPTHPASTHAPTLGGAGSRRSMMTLRRESGGGGSALVLHPAAQTKETAGFVEDTTLDIPPLADTVKLVPGVTLREGEIVKRGPTLKQSPTPPPPLRTYTTHPSTAPRPQPPTVASPTMSTIIPTSRPVVRPVPFPVYRGSNKYPRLPDIKPEEHDIPHHGAGGARKPVVV
ncbi:hypothetical protein HK104_006849 [Borealophlyctis nickersoniae]|nr:hypothetical protein HK104_006849 [Borealophlyctis nickersoniae]